MYNLFLVCLKIELEIIFPPSTAHECWENKNNVVRVSHKSPIT